MARHYKENEQSKALHWDVELYRPEVLKSGILPIKEVRKEYTRLRNVMNKRVDRLIKSGFEDSEIVRQNKGWFESQSKLTDNDVIYALADLSTQIQAKTSVVGGMRDYIEQNVESLLEHGYEGVTSENFLLFAEFMDKYHAQENDKVYGSDEIVELFAKNVSGGEERLNEISSDFKKYVSNKKIIATKKVQKERAKSKQTYIKERTKRRRGG